MKTTALLTLALLALPAIAAPAKAAQAFQDAQELGALDVPDVPLIDQDGKPVRFYTDLVKGRVVAMSFIFTSCTTICPPIGASFGRLEKLVAGKDVHLISVSIDPANDTPERLKAWSQKFGAGSRWTLVTGDRDQVTRLLKALGAYTPNAGNHSPLVLLGNERSHRWTRAYGFAAPARLVELIDQLAAPEAAASLREGRR